MALTRDQIVDAAIRILGTEGPDALSMRRLGAELGSGATSIYWHVATKDDLLDLVADRVIGEILAGVEPASSWRTWMESFARSMREVLLAHPGVAAVVGSRAAIGPNARRALDELLPLLRSDGFDEPASMLASTTLVSWMTALVLTEAREARPARAHGGVRGAAAIPTADDRFEYGLGVLVAGIAARRAQPRHRDGGTGG
jgi:AcrR family transcriptional regulator